MLINRASANRKPGSRHGECRPWRRKGSRPDKKIVTLKVPLWEGEYVKPSPHLA
jgi:hypothetical protein